jgi:hypothetical protein
MKQTFLKCIAPHLLVVAAFFALTLAYFLPAFQGEVLPQHDQIQAQGMSHELQTYHHQTGKTSLWSNSMFSGMPAYLIYTGDAPNIFTHLQRFLRFGLPYETACILFIYLLGFYVFFTSLGFKPWLGALGSIAFAFCSYNIIIIMAGHITKAYAMAYVPPVLAGILLTYRGRYLQGALLTLIALGLQISCNHYQITYYMGLMIGVLLICLFIKDFKEKQLKKFFIASSFVLIASILSVIPNLSQLWTTAEYGHFSTRGPSELTDTKGNQTTGLDKDYILNDYSYGVGETFTLLIPNFRGGASGGALTEESNAYKLLVENNVQGANEIIKSMPLYWGGQRYTAGPVYFGAIVCFLFILGLFVVRGPIKWWLATTFTLSVMLAWGQNFMTLSDLFLKIVPGYDKFRTVSMILTVANYSAVILGIFALKELFAEGIDVKAYKKKLLYSFYITGGLSVLFALLAGMAGDFSSSYDSNLPQPLADALRLDRESLLRSDAFRSFAFILLAGIAIWFALEKKLKTTYLWAILCVLVLADGWVVDRRYLNSDNFKSKQAFAREIAPTAADLEIMKDTTHYRVMNLSVDPFNDATTSYYHNSIGGYHGAKMKRYQELIEHQLSKNNMHVLDMLNAKYFIVVDQKQHTPMVQQNPNALGNAWFVNSVKTAENADAEMAALDSLNPAREAVVDKRFAAQVEKLAPVADTSTKASIKLVSYLPDQLGYVATTDKDRLAVFSEIYYPKGWQAYLDGKPVDHLRANYVLRGLVIPAGEHKVEFKFESTSYNKGHKVAMAGSILVLLAAAGAGAYLFVQRKKEQNS